MLIPVVSFDIPRYKLFTGFSATSTPATNGGIAGEWHYASIEEEKLNNHTFYVFFFRRSHYTQAFAVNNSAEGDTAYPLISPQSYINNKTSAIMIYIWNIIIKHFGSVYI